MSTLRIEIFPDDLSATIGFYRDLLGFEVTKDERDAEAPYVSFRFGDVRVGAAERPPCAISPRRPPTGVELVLEVDDLIGLYDRVRRAGWPIDEYLVARPWGLEDFRLLDPSGYYWRVTSTSGEGPL